MGIAIMMEHPIPGAGVAIGKRFPMDSLQILAFCLDQSLRSKFRICDRSINGKVSTQKRSNMGYGQSFN
jgi:hypothetical protein